MPLFYIDTSDDTSDQNRFVRDEEGLECRDLDAAKARAVAALPDMARDELPDGDTRTFLAIVRDGEGRSLLRASLTLSVSSLAPGSER